MFLESCVIFSVAFVIFVFALLSARNPDNSLLNRSSFAQICVSVLLTGLFTFSLIGFVSEPVSLGELVLAAAMAIGLVVFYRMMRVKRRLEAFATHQKAGQIIIGDFTTPSPANKPAEPPYRKAA